MVDPKGKGIRIFKCQQPGHMTYNCPRKNLHIGLEFEGELEPPNEEDGSSFDYGAYDPVDLGIGWSTSLCGKVYSCSTQS